MKLPRVLSLTFILVLFTFNLFSQTLMEDYKPAKKDSLRIGTEEKDVLPYISSGYSLMLPDNDKLEGVLIFLEDSAYELKTKNAKQIYSNASEAGFAVLSVSTEIPLDFYFTNDSLQMAHVLIETAFVTHNLPNTNIFFLGGSLVGHRAMQYIKYMKIEDLDFQLNIKGIVMCNFTLDWTRKWRQHQRDITLNRINLWEPKFINYMLETYLKGTPETVPENYHNFSPYSYFDSENNTLDFYKDYAIKAYIEPAINYRLEKYYRTLYDNNAPDIVGFIAELRLLGNDNTELTVIQPDDTISKQKTAQSTWDTIDKEDLMEWIIKQSSK